MHLRAQTPQPPLPPQRERGLGLASFIQPALDYAAAAFPLRTALGTPNSRYPEPDRRPAPPLAYSALEACADGFTRSPEEGDVLVCPRCDRELCVEEPTPAAQGSSKKNTSSSAKAIKTKQEQGRDEVWIVKACGHVSVDSFRFLWTLSSHDTKLTSPGLLWCLCSRSQISYQEERQIKDKSQGQRQRIDTDTAGGAVLKLPSQRLPREAQQQDTYGPAVFVSIYL